MEEQIIEFLKGLERRENFPLGGWPFDSNHCGFRRLGYSEREGVFFLSFGEECDGGYEGHGCREDYSFPEDSFLQVIRDLRAKRLASFQDLLAYYEFQKYEYNHSYSAEDESTNLSARVLASGILSLDSSGGLAQPQITHRLLQVLDSLKEEAKQR
jgi:hypothetical protein